MKYNIIFSATEENSFFSIPIKEHVEANKAIGDNIWIGHKDGENSLEINSFISVNDPEIRDFIYEHFKNPLAVLGFLRKILE